MFHYVLNIWKLLLIFGRHPMTDSSEDHSTMKLALLLYYLLMFESYSSVLFHLENIGLSVWNNKNE
jgi:hypothetical protein